MSTVIINQFDLIPAEPDGGAAQDSIAEGTPATASPGRSPVQEAEQLIRHQMERSLRVWAH